MHTRLLMAGGFLAVGVWAWDTALPDLLGFAPSAIQSSRFLQPVGLWIIDHPILPALGLGVETGDLYGADLAFLIIGLLLIVAALFV